MTAPKLSITTPNGRYYAHPRRHSQVPSITNVMKQKNKPGIPYWATKKAAEYAADNLDALTALDRDGRVRAIKGAPWDDKSASQVGDTVHDWIDRRVKGFAIPLEEIESQPRTAQNMLKTFDAFCLHYKPTFNDAEFTVWSEKYGYAGTGDLDISLGGMRVLVDTKTGNRVYWDYGMQLAAINFADFIIDEYGNEKPIPEWEKFAILHIRPTQFQLVPVVKIEECFQGFLGLKASFDLEVIHGDSVLGYAPKVKTATVE